MMNKNESPLPLTDPRDAVALRMLNILYHIIWQSNHFFYSAYMLTTTCAIIKESMPKTTQAALSLSTTVMAEAAGKFYV